MEQFDAKADLIELAVDCPLGILLYVAIIYQRCRHLPENRMQKWWYHIHPFLLSVFVVGSGLCLLFSAITSSPDPPAPAYSGLWKATMILCLTVSALYPAYEILRFDIYCIYYIAIVIFLVVWIVLIRLRNRYSALCVPGWISSICAVALFECAVRRCKTTKARRGCLILGLMSAFWWLVSIVLGMVSLLVVPVPCHFTIQYSIPFLIIAFTAGRKQCGFRVEEKESAKRQVDIQLGVYNPENVARQVESGSA